jgi:hypothetical protein
MNGCKNSEKLVGIDGEPLTFDVTGGEAHEVKGYEALIELRDVAEVQAWLASRRSRASSIPRAGSSLISGRHWLGCPRGCS